MSLVYIIEYMFIWRKMNLNEINKMFIMFKGHNGTIFINKIAGA